MKHKSTVFLGLTLIFGSCVRNIKELPPKPEPPLIITCENEKYLIENKESNTELSFDTIHSPKKYWHIVGVAQRKSDKRVFPYLIIQIDSSANSMKLRVPVVGPREWRPDGRIKLHLDAWTIDSNSIRQFFKSVADTANGQHVSKIKSEIVLTFPGNYITDLQFLLRILCREYIAYQHKYALENFKKDVCNLNKTELDSLKNAIPLRIRFITNMGARDTNIDSLKKIIK